MREDAPRWVKVLGPDDLPEGSVRAVDVGARKICLVHHRGRYAALANECLHQGGPLGEGRIENGRLVCPWHGWKFEPLTGRLVGYEHGVGSYPVEARADGIYVDPGGEAEDGSRNPWRDAPP